MWVPSKEVKYGVAVCRFDGCKVSHGLSLQIGDCVQVLEECSGWYRGINLKTKNKKGIFPANVVHQKPCKVDNEGPFESVTPLEDAAAKEVAEILREWMVIWKELYLEQNVELFHGIRFVMMELKEWRRHLLSGTVTQDLRKEIRTKIVNKIDWGNRKLGLDLVPRLQWEQVDGDEISAVELYNIHRQASHPGGRKESQASIVFKPRILTHHLYLSLKSFGCSVGDETEVYFTLYDAKHSRTISERFLARLTRNGLPVNHDKIYNYCALFTDLSNDDLLLDMYLVAHIYRIGKMLVEKEGSKSKVPLKTYRRPYGCAVVHIQEVLLGNALIEENEDGRELQMKVYVAHKEEEFPQIHEHIIKKQSGKYSLSSAQTNLGIVVSISMHHGELVDVQKAKPIIFTRGVAMVRKMGFSDVIMPGDVRNDLYLTLSHGDFDRGSKTSSKNIEVKVTVLDKDGAIIKDSIHYGAGENPCSEEYYSTVFYHNNVPKWNDTIKLTVPIDKFYGSHFRLEFRHCSTKSPEKKLFSFGFAKLMNEDGTTMKDGCHELYLYKTEDVSKLKSVDYYIDLPFMQDKIELTAGGSQGNTFFQRATRETITIETKLCSTKLTQNVDLLGFLKWRSEPESVQLTLEKLRMLDGQEKVKFLQDIMDTLFSMFSLEENSVSPKASQVFQTLVSIFGLLEDRRFEHFKPVMDAYISNHFSAPLVYSDLLNCLKDQLDGIDAADSRPETGQVTFQVLENIFKLIVKSRILFTRASGGNVDEEFKIKLYQVFNSIGKVLFHSTDAAPFSKAQLLLVENIASILPHLAEVLDRTELSKLVSDTIQMIPKDCSSKINRAKLQCMSDIVNGDIFKYSEPRAIIQIMVLGQIKRCLINKQDLKPCAALLGDMLTIFHDIKKAECIDSSLRSVVTVLLDVLVQTIIAVDRTSEAAGRLISCLISMLRLMSPKHYTAVIEGYINRKPLKDFLLHILIVFQSLVKQDVFPRDWMVMRMVSNNVILTAVQIFSQAIIERFLKNKDFEYDLWQKYFSFAVSFLTQPCLQLENFSELKRSKIIDKYRDMRVLMGFEILTMWKTLDKHKIIFIPGIVGQFLEVTLVPETELRKATLPIFYDMMECEYADRGNFKQVESELIDKLDILVSENKGDSEYKNLFNSILLYKMKQTRLEETGSQFVMSVTSLLERLLDYRNVIEGDERRDKRMTCTVNLLNFYKNEINREEMYVRYIYKLCDLHLAADNYTEAGFTLLLHANLLSWQDHTLHADLKYPGQMEWQRKEQIYLEIIGYFDRGKSWENGIPLCKQLAHFYETKIYNYTKLSEILRTQATFFDNILSEARECLRPDPEYFRVGFYGQRFPMFLRNKVFVYRGEEYEKLSDFKDRMSEEFTNAKSMRNSCVPDESIKMGEAPYLQICAVKPVPVLREEFEGGGVSEKILSFYKVNEVNRFQYDRPFHEGTKDPKNEFKTLCIERTTMRTAGEFPGILRWFEVTQSESVKLTPIETAIDSMDGVNLELRGLVNKYTMDSARNLNPLTMRLNGVIDAAVNGGASRYQDAFCSQEFAIEHPEHDSHICQLKSLFSEQIQLLEGALSLHGRLAPHQVQPLHQRMVQLFASMKKGIKDSGSPNLSFTLRRTDRTPIPDNLSDVIRPITPTSRSSASNSMSSSGSQPGSNRSSAIYEDDNMYSSAADDDNYEHMDFDGPPTVEDVDMYEPITPTPPSATYIQPSRAPGRVQSAYYQRTTPLQTGSRSSQISTGSSSRIRNNSDPNLNANIGNMKVAPSSTSLDSGIGTDSNRGSTASTGSGLGRPIVTSRQSTPVGGSTPMSVTATQRQLSTPIINSSGALTGSSTSQAYNGGAPRLPPRRAQTVKSSDGLTSVARGIRRHKTEPDGIKFNQLDLTSQSTPSKGQTDAPPLPPRPSPLSPPGGATGAKISGTSSQQRDIIQSPQNSSGNPTPVQSPLSPENLKSPNLKPEEAPPLPTRTRPPSVRPKPAPRSVSPQKTLKASEQTDPSKTSLHQTNL
ncbi:unnamed protein product [Owenia fusiformis]|uniref:Uncharacterized protein n=1 Tax=Owenia fusiformis TaxID=6347 RepID=A0A8J1T4I0_OWEFU|nr:unnamed protein product [Owenia fusiformis]